MDRGSATAWRTFTTHAARKVPLVNIVGDHATHHVQYDTPLQSDIEALAGTVSAWVRTSRGADELARDAAAAISAAIGPPAQIATLIVPADVSWGDGGQPALAPDAGGTAFRVRGRRRGARRGRSAAGVGRASCSAVPPVRERGLIAAARIAAATGAILLAERSAPRLERGAGMPAVERLAYWPELVASRLDGLEHLILAEARAPVSFFAYPGAESSLVPRGCEVHELAPAGCDVIRGLEDLAEALGAATAAPVLAQPSVPPAPTGPLSWEKVSQAIGATLPDGAIVSDESMTSGAALAPSTAGAPRHDWLTLTGGAIGQGLPVAVGAAVACPDRPVIALEADGSALYTIQSLWTMAREQLDVTVVILNNRAYRILGVELDRLAGDGPGPAARALLDLGDPDIDFVDLGTGLGVPSRRVKTADELTVALQRAVADPGPHLIEAVVPSGVTARPRERRSRRGSLRVSEPPRRVTRGAASGRTERSRVPSSRAATPAGVAAPWAS